MGYEAKRKIFKLVFADTEMEGLEVTVRSTSMGNILQMAELDEMNPLALTKEDVDKIRKLFAILAGAMLSWNLEEDGVPVPATLESILAQEPEFVMTIIKSWTRAMTQASGPLAQPSLDGERSLEASIPMETLSQSQAS
jgi:hypothetical protein